MLTAEEYKLRRRDQMLRFYGATFLTLVSARIAFRSTQTKRYLPSLFQANHLPPPFSYQHDAMSAVVHATMLSTSSFGMFLTGLAWTWDVSNFKEFSFKLKHKLGGDVIEEEIKAQPQDPELASLSGVFSDALKK